MKSFGDIFCEIFGCEIFQGDNFCKIFGEVYIVKSFCGIFCDIFCEKLLWYPLWNLLTMTQRL
jgi:hypothetical protein